MFSPRDSIYYVWGIDIYPGKYYVPIVYDIYLYDEDILTYFMYILLYLRQSVLNIHWNFHLLPGKKISNFRYPNKVILTFGKGKIKYFIVL